MPTSENKKIINYWEGGYPIEQSVDAGSNWTDVDDTIEPDWDFNDVLYRVKASGTTGYFNVHTSSTGTDHFLLGPHADAATADANKDKSSLPRTARIQVTWTNDQYDA